MFIKSLRKLLREEEAVAEQRARRRVGRRLEKAGHSLSEEEFPKLLAAAMALDRCTLKGTGKLAGDHGGRLDLISSITLPTGPIAPN